MFLLLTIPRTCKGNKLVKPPVLQHFRSDTKSLLLIGIYCSNSEKKMFHNSQLKINEVSKVSCRQ